MKDKETKALYKLVTTIVKLANKLVTLVIIVARAIIKVKRFIEHSIAVASTVATITILIVFIT